MEERKRDREKRNRDKKAEKGKRDRVTERVNKEIKGRGKGERERYERFGDFEKE